MTNTDKEVVVLLGAGAIGLAIARRVATNKVVLLGDISEKNLEAAKTELENAGFTAETAVVDGGDRQSIQAFADKADALGKVTRYIHTAGVSPNQASFKDIVRVDLVGTAIALEVFGKIIADGGSGIVVASMAGHMFVDNVTLEQRKALAQTPADELADLDFLQDDTIPGGGYGISKQANILRVQAESLNWQNAVHVSIQSVRVSSLRRLPAMNLKPIRKVTVLWLIIQLQNAWGQRMKSDRQELIF